MFFSLTALSHFFIPTCHSPAGLMEQRWKMRLNNLTGCIAAVSSSNLLLYLSCCIFYFFLCANSPAQPLGSADKLRISSQRRRWRTVLLPRAFSCPTTWHPWNSVTKSGRKWQKTDKANAWCCHVAAIKRRHITFHHLPSPALCVSILKCQNLLVPFFSLLISRLCLSHEASQVICVWLMPLSCSSPS